jgi:hypothetical protein
MPPDNEELKRLHAAHAATARRLYLENRLPAEDAEDWRAAIMAARRIIAEALRASNFLENVSDALQSSGAHTLAFRHFFAPPISQDQFRLLCPTWSKGSEKKGTPLSPDTAAAVANTVSAWRDHRLTRWLDSGRRPASVEIRRVLAALAPLIAAQMVATMKRNRLAARQENAVITLLEEKGWTKLPSALIDTRAAVPQRHFMHKTRFATATSAPQEVDIACGLPETVVLAMECKVTNDETNSVKRINDVLKKAAAWRTHWGSFVKTAALLEGVIAAKDVERLIDSNVVVFWSHELETFSAWLDDQF